LIEVAFAMSGQRVADAIDTRPADAPLPVSITVDHGTEFTSKAPEDWAWRQRRPHSSLETVERWSLKARLARLLRC
jgi:hypothetical protein